MSDMIERAGRAALCGWNNVPTDNATMAAEWERMGPATRRAWMRAMRAAIAAMREPTKEMIMAGEDEDDNHTDSTRDSYGVYDFRVPDAAPHIWQAMIDAALGDKTC